jgi:SAM-dependent methyltransferase
MTRDYLTELLRTYWFAPPVALWRAIELRVAAEEAFERPLLDLGCGDGLIARALFGSGRTVDVGVDPWVAQVRRAARSAAYRRVDVADGHHLPYADGSFATVFSNSVLEHIPDVRSVLREAGRVLRRGGHVVFTVPSDCFRRFLHGYVQRMTAGYSGAAEAYADEVDARFEHRHYYSVSEWRDLLGAAGLRLIEARYYVPEAVERLWDRMNDRFGVGQRWTAWGALVSPRLRWLGYHTLLSRFVEDRLSRAWRPYYDMDVPPGQRGGGLLVVAERNPG